MTLTEKWRVEWTERDGLVLDTFFDENESLVSFIDYLVRTECVPLSVEAL
jgi:hypothetical protein